MNQPKNIDMVTASLANVKMHMILKIISLSNFMEYTYRMSPTLFSKLALAPNKQNMNLNS